MEVQLWPFFGGYLDGFVVVAHAVMICVQSEVLHGVCLYYCLWMIISLFFRTQNDQNMVEYDIMCVPQSSSNINELKVSNL